MNATPSPTMGSETANSPPPPLPAEIAVKCPFTVIVDTREQQPYTFAGLRTNADQGNKLIRVPIVREALGVGDYGIRDMDAVVVERKSKADLYQSVVRRENFIGRLDRMSEQCTFAAIVVECEWADMLLNPPPRSQFAPKALARTIITWSMRYPIVHWFFLPDRESAESFTFRVLERFWIGRQHGDYARTMQFDGLAPNFPINPSEAANAGGRS